ncbi:hypothetical protein NKG05_13695 [Oerskovia sp. M15]
MADVTRYGTGGRRAPVPYLALLVTILAGALWAPPALADPGPEAPDGNVTWACVRRRPPTVLNAPPCGSRSHRARPRAMPWW